MKFIKIFLFFLLTLNLHAIHTTITYTYNGVGNITEIQTPTQTISKTYDKLNRLKSVTDDKGTTTYDYDAIGRQTQVTYPNGASTHYTYDSRNRVTKIEHKDSTDTVLQSFTYTLDSVGNRTKVVEESNRTTEYEYNNVHQLTKETVTNDPNGQNTVTTFSYDLVGNLLTKTIDGVATSYSYNDNDQLTQQGTSTLTYDGNGNLIAKDDITYEYDAQNRLIRVVTPTDTVEYTYDANDNRVAKSVNGDTTTYLVDTNTPYAQVITESKNGTTIEYTYGNDLISNGSSYFLTDALGSTRGLIDDAGQLTDSYSYTPYGELSSHNGTSSNNFLFTGEQFDAETEDYYLRARYYSPNAARFLSRDTFDGTGDSPLSQNHYMYTHGNPVMYTDPSGNMAIGFGSIVNSFFRTMAIAMPRMVSFARPALVNGGRALPRVLLPGSASVGRSSLSLSEMSNLLTLARLAARTAAAERSDEESIPIQVYGYNNLPEHQSHIFRSMIGLGSNKNPTSAILTRVGRSDNDRNFLGRKSVCGGYPRPDGKHCDEYPYNSSLQGGTANFELGNVSVQLVNRRESNKQGGFIRNFYTKSPVDIDDNFLVIPLGSVSGYFDKRGKWHVYNK